MSKQANPIAIGGFVLGALALVVIAILVFSSGRLFQAKTEAVTYFPGSVQGLTVGAPVEFQGVQVGEVTQIRLDYRSDQQQFRIPVHYDLWRESVTVMGERPHEIEGKPPLQFLVEDRGLRAQLVSVSLVTGQYIVALSFQPESPLKYVGEEKRRIEIPAIEATRDRVANMLQGLDLTGLINTAIGTLNALRKLAEDSALHALASDADQAVIEARKFLADLDAGVKPLLQRADDTLDDYAGLAQTASQRLTTLAESLEKTSADISTLARDVDRQVKPLSQSAMGVLESMEDTVSEGSAPRYNLELLLEEGASAARSLRLLADYLEQNPDALIRGKYGR
ncbi:MAG: MlaD family protein [Gammaproteobacteria bacterium]|jgi:paraquat-inducible protein B